jgi:hypothetical protein
MKKISSVLIASLFVVACGGGSGSESKPGTVAPSQPSKAKNLSKEPALKELYTSIQKAQVKGEFEKTTDYDTRIDVFTESLTDYVVSAKILTSYDADKEELYIYTLPYEFTEGENEASVVFYTGYTSLRFQNINDLYTTVTRESQNAFTGEPLTRHYYKVITVSPSEAEEIIDGFMVDYEIEFNVEQVLSSENRCISANFTQCINYIYTDVVNYKVYNTVNGQDYY